MKNKYVRLLVALGLPQLAGLIGSVFTMKSIPGWYAFLEKPALTPPNYVFAPAWTTLYVLMGVAFFLVWRAKPSRDDFRLATLVFHLQLALNAFWSIAFFGLQDPFLGLLVIGSLWILIWANILLFYRISRPAGLLLVPYLLWVSFASYLNYMIWILN